MFEHRVAVHGGRLGAPVAVGGPGVRACPRRPVARDARHRDRIAAFQCEFFGDIQINYADRCSSIDQHVEGFGSSSDSDFDPDKAVFKAKGNFLRKPLTEKGDPEDHSQYLDHGAD